MAVVACNFLLHIINDIRLPLFLFVIRSHPIAYNTNGLEFLVVYLPRTTELQWSRIPVDLELQ